MHTARPLEESCFRSKITSLVAVLAAGALPLLAGCGTQPTTTTSSSADHPGNGGHVRSDIDPLRGHGDAILDLDVVIRLKHHPGQAAVFDDLGVAAVEVLEDGLTWRAELLPGETLAGVMAAAVGDDRVESVERNTLITLPESAQSSMAFSEGTATIQDYWDQGISDRLGLRVAHSISNGRGVKVAVMDTGVNATHPLLMGRVLSDGYDFVDQDSDPSDLPDGIDNDGDGILDEAAGHGCHVAGLVTIVAPGAMILPVRVLNSDGTGTAYSVARGIEYAVSRGARVINLSLSMTMSANVVSQAIGNAVAKGVILVCAAGNKDANGNISPLNYPASDGRVWAVGSLDGEGRPSNFSAPGPGVLFSAPGENLLSAYLDDGYASWSGTSMSAPLVSGTAALYLAMNRWQSPDAVRARLVSTALPVAGDYALVGAGQIHPGFVMAYLGAGGSTESGASDALRRGGH